MNNYLIYKVWSRIKDLPDTTSADQLLAILDPELRSDGEFLMTMFYAVPKDHWSEIHFYHKALAIRRPYLYHPGKRGRAYLR